MLFSDLYTSDISILYMVETAKFSQIYQCKSQKDPIRFDAMAQLFLVDVRCQKSGLKPTVNLYTPYNNHQCGGVGPKHCLFILV